MAYIGTKPTVGNFQICDAISVVNGQAAYTMQVGSVNVTPQSANYMIVSLNGTIQKPNSSYTVSGSTITFSSNLATGDVIDFIQILGDVLDLGVPSDATVTTAKLASNSVTYEKIGYNANQYRNIIINGDMNIAQRGTSFTGLTNGSSDYTVDRFRFNESGSMTSVFTFSQDTDVPSGQGFAKSLKIQNTTAGSGHNVVEAIQFIEAQNLQYLKFGTSSAENLTLSFWVKCSETGTGNVSIYNLDATRQIAKNYTINSANTWEKKTLSIPGDTSGSFNNDNGAGLGIYFALAASSGYNGGTPGSWGSYSDGLRGAGMTIDLTNSTSDNIYITGVQLEAGTTASDFEFLPVDVNLRRCQRYYFLKATHNRGGSGGSEDIGIGTYYTSSSMRANVAFPIEMRAKPSIDVATVSNGYLIRVNNTSDSFDNFTINNPSLTSTQIINASASGTQGQAGLLFSDNSSCFLAFDSEL